jgi:hypothetical protein
MQIKQGKEEKKRKSVDFTATPNLCGKIGMIPTSY